MYKILVVEDDATIAAAIVQHIQSWGFTAHCVGDFRQVLTEFVQFSPQLVLLDISLPFFNGYHWCCLLYTSDGSVVCSSSSRLYRVWILCEMVSSPPAVARSL